MSTRSHRKIFFPVKLLMFVLAIGWQSVFSQRYVDVVPDATGTIGALNIAIASDTTDTGERIDPDNTIYRLERGGTYNLNLAIRNAGFPLTIEAEEGDGARPRIVPGVTLEGNVDLPFRPLDDVTLRGIFLTGRDQNSGLQGQLIRVQSQDVRIVIDDCVFDESSQSAVRLDSRGARIFMRNSIVSRMGTPDDIDNGRVIDDRNNFIDTLVVENSTVYNITSRIVRDGSGTDSYMNYCVFNQNTIINVGQRIADFGPIINFTFTNNIVVNPSFLATGVDADPFNPTEPDPNGDTPTAGIVLDSVSQEILSNAGMTQTATISHNNFYTTQVVLDAHPAINPDPDSDDVIVQRPIFSPAALAFIEANNSADTNIEEVIAFSNPVPDPITFIVDNWNNIDGTNILGPWNNEGIPFDLSYAQNQLSATASSSGEQLGDLNWSLIVFSKEALEELLLQANNLLGTSTEGNNIGNVTSLAFDSLRNTVAAATIVLDDATATTEEVEEAVNALRDAIDFFFRSIITSIVEPAFNQKIQVYPVPANTILNIKTPQLIKQVEIYDIRGIRHLQILEQTGDLHINTETLDAGVYLLNLHLNDGSTSQQRLIIQR